MRMSGGWSLVQPRVPVAGPFNISAAQPVGAGHSSGSWTVCRIGLELSSKQPFRRATPNVPLRQLCLRVNLRIRAVAAYLKPRDHRMGRARRRPVMLPLQEAGFVGSRAGPAGNRAISCRSHRAPRPGAALPRHLPTCSSPMRRLILQATGRSSPLPDRAHRARRLPARSLPFRPRPAPCAWWRSRRPARLAPPRRAPHRSAAH